MTLQPLPIHLQLPREEEKEGEEEMEDDQTDSQVTPRPLEALDVPGFDVLDLRVHVEREVEEVGHHWYDLAVGRQTAGLKDIDAFEDQNIRSVNRLK